MTKQQDILSRNPFVAGLQYYGSWLLTALLMIPTLLRLKGLVLVLAVLVINNDAWRPTGWSLSTLVGVDKCITLLGIAIWLMIVMFAERHIGQALQSRQFWSQVGRMWLIIVIVYVVCEISLRLLN